jgi:hypothetical protein
MVTTLRPIHTDPATAQARGLHWRASSLRSQAHHLEPVLAMTYRRRASELELEAFLVGLQADDLGDRPGPVADGAPAA